MAFLYSVWIGHFGCCLHHRHIGEIWWECRWPHHVKVAWARRILRCAFGFWARCIPSFPVRDRCSRTAVTPRYQKPRAECVRARKSGLSLSPNPFPITPKLLWSLVSSDRPASGRRRLSAVYPSCRADGVIRGAEPRRAERRTLGTNRPQSVCQGRTAWARRPHFWSF